MTQIDMTKMREIMNGSFDEAFEKHAALKSTYLTRGNHYVPPNPPEACRVDEQTGKKLYGRKLYACLEGNDQY